MRSDNVELLAPAGDFQTALSAFEAGADAVYCGLADFSARAFAANLSFEELKDLVKYSRVHGKKVYVTFNTVLDESQLEDAIETLAMLNEIRPDAVIVQDLGVARVCRKHFPELELHASTQLVAHNLEGVLAMGEVGFKRVVLARELSLEEIASIAKRCGKIELESFIHGALCYSISGLCLFSAMEKGRSGNRGKCAYCCRLPYEEEGGKKTLAFSMKDLRLGEDARKLMEAGVSSLKIEGRMKSPLYVASVTKYYRNILDQAPGRVTIGDLETVFSRRTTELYVNGKPKDSVIDSESLGHLGTEIGRVKKITKDRDGLAWLRLHTARALEKHDGLQFETMVDGKHVGMGIVEMRQAISRRPVFEVNAGADVEVLLPEEGLAVEPGTKIYCSMSNAVKRMFPMPSFRPSDYDGSKKVDVDIELSKAGVRVTSPVELDERIPLEAAKNPEKTEDAIKKAFSKLGGTDYRLGKIKLEDPDGRFVPMSVLNDLRRDMVEKLDDIAVNERRKKTDAAIADDESPQAGGKRVEPVKRIRLRAGQRLPHDDWQEIIVVVDAENADVSGYPSEKLRIGLPVYTSELRFNQLRNVVKRLIRGGVDRFEASDLATLRMLKGLGVSDITADWTLYAFNSRALAELSEFGVRRFVASPENDRENLQYLAESGYEVEFLRQQSTPLFISLTKPANEHPRSLRVFNCWGLWVTTKMVARRFELPEGMAERIDLSWDSE